MATPPNSPRPPKPPIARRSLGGPKIPRLHSARMSAEAAAVRDPKYPRAEGAEPQRAAKPPSVTTPPRSPKSPVYKSSKRPEPASETPEQTIAERGPKTPRWMSAEELENRSLGDTKEPITYGVEPKRDAERPMAFLPPPEPKYPLAKGTELKRPIETLPVRDPKFPTVLTTCS